MNKEVNDGDKNHSRNVKSSLVHNASSDRDTNDENISHCINVKSTMLQQTETLAMTRRVI